MAGAFEPPDVLVLGGGGILGEAWMTALLAGIEQATDWDARDCEGYVGTSAGSIVAAALAGRMSASSRVGSMPELPADRPDSHGAVGPGLLGQVLEAGRAAGLGTAAPLAALGLRSTAVGGALARRVALGRVPRGRRSLGGLRAQVDRSGAAWDGRLLVCAVELESGRRVTFGAPEAPQATVGQAVEASCAIPGYFRPVEIGGRSYVDGGAWSPTNMDAARVRRGGRVLCLNPTGAFRPSRASPAGALGPLSRSISAVEALALSRRGARVQTVAPDRETLAAIGGNLMNPAQRGAVTTTGVSQGRALALGS